MNTVQLVNEARDELSLLSRMALSRASMEVREGLTFIHLDEAGWEVMQLERVREEIERAVKRVMKTEVRFG